MEGYPTHFHAIDANSSVSRHLAAVGAGLTVFALPIDALIQSAISIPQQRVFNDVLYERSGANITNTTTFPKTSEYFGWQAMRSTEEPWATTEMINAVKFGISYMSGLGDSISADTVVECPTGYCDFGKYQTLGVHYSCVDRSNDIVEVEEENSYPYLTIPGTGLQLYHQGGSDFLKMLIAANSSGHSDEDVFDTPGPLIVRTALLVDNWKGADPVGMECALFWRVKTALGKVEIGSLDQNEGSFMSETTEPEFFEFNLNPDNKQFAYLLNPKDECWINNDTLTEAEDPDLYIEECCYAVGAEAQIGLQSLLLDPTDGLVGESMVKEHNEETNYTEWNPTNHFVTNVFELIEGTRDGFIEEIDSMFNNIAISMSHVVRRYPIQRTNDTKTPGYTTGYVYRYVFLYQVNWKSLTLPAILVFGSALFTVVTAILTAGEHGWRRSNLPLLFHGLGSAEREVCGEIKSLGAMEDAAEGMRVKLQNMDEGAKLVGAMH